MGLLFGTDGVRGVANRDLTAEMAYKLGRLGAHVLSLHNGRGPIVVGKDTRISGDLLESALVAGILSAGVDVLKVGIMPTPAIAFLTRELGGCAGAVISASHNPVEDNGIKFFGSSGYKLSDELENEIESLFWGTMHEVASPVGGALGRIHEIKDAASRYVRYSVEAVKMPQSNLKIVVDCANGAAYQVAPEVLRHFSPNVIAINNQPDGVNINHGCGSTCPEAVCRVVLEEKADLGLTLDGDADRLLVVDARGELVDGDQIMYILARHFKETGLLPGNTVAITVMSNLGLRLALQKEGISVCETRVGDRYVLEELLRCGACFGGEQSGHIIHLGFNTTGDGLLTALLLLQAVQRAGAPLRELAMGMEKMPQLLKNVPVVDKGKVMTSTALAVAIKEREEILGAQGRLLVRPSGTEPLVRVMAEGRDYGFLNSLVDELVEVVRKIDQEVV